MTTTRDLTPAGQGPQGYNTGAVGLTLFAGIMLIMSGVFHLVQGIVALANDTFYVVGKEYAFKFDVTAWGWIHVIGGIVMALAGFALFRAALWARIVAVTVACLSMLASFAWLPYYPLWSLVVITVDGFVIWALTAHGRDITRA